MKGSRRTLALVTDGAAKSIDGVVLEDVARMNGVRQRNIGHPRIVNSVMTGNAAVHSFELRNADLFQFDTKIARDGAALVVLGFRIQNCPVLFLQAVPLGVEIFANRGGNQVANRE